MATISCCIEVLMLGKRQMAAEPLPYQGHHRRRETNRYIIRAVLYQGCKKGGTSKWPHQPSAVLGPLSWGGNKWRHEHCRVRFPKRGVRISKWLNYPTVAPPPPPKKTECGEQNGFLAPAVPSFPEWGAKFLPPPKVFVKNGKFGS